MATEVSICNLALSNLGDEAKVTSISGATGDGSAQAKRCVMFYPIARDAVLSRHPWNFATLRADLVESPLDPPDSWAFAYTLPTDYNNVIGVYPAGALQDAESEDYIIENGVIYSNTEDAVIRYTRLVTDTTKYPPLMVIALARILASFLAGPLIKGMEGMRVGQEQLKIFEQVELPRATATDANNRKNDRYDDFTPSNIKARA
jgi:hypothetical protein